MNEAWVDLIEGAILADTFRALKIEEARAGAVRDTNEPQTLANEANLDIVTAGSWYCKINRWILYYPQ